MPLQLGVPSVNRASSGMGASCMKQLSGWDTSSTALFLPQGPLGHPHDLELGSADGTDNGWRNIFLVKAAWVEEGKE